MAVRLGARGRRGDGLGVGASRLWSNSCCFLSIGDNQVQPCLTANPGKPPIGPDV